MQTRSVTGGDFSCKRQLETPLRCKVQEKIASRDSAFSQSIIFKSALKELNRLQMYSKPAAAMLGGNGKYRRSVE